MRNSRIEGRHRVCTAWCLTLCSVALLLLPVSRSKAQVHANLEWPVPHDIVSVDLGAIAINEVMVRWAHAVSGTDAVVVSVGTLFHPVGNQRLHGWQVLLHYRNHPEGMALWRFFWSVGIGMQSISARDPIATTTGLVADGRLGWQYLPVQSFAVGAAIGLQNRFGGRSDLNPAVDRAYGLQAVLQFDLGYAW